MTGTVGEREAVGLCLMETITPDFLHTMVALAFLISSVSLPERHCKHWKEIYKYLLMFQ
jgi:hypothetical protein